MKMLSLVGKEGLGSKLVRPLSPTTVQGAARLRAMLVIIAIFKFNPPRDIQHQVDITKKIKYP